MKTMGQPAIAFLRIPHFTWKQRVLGIVVVPIDAAYSHPAKIISGKVHFLVKTK